jgi:chromosome segregation ATPase
MGNTKRESKYLHKLRALQKQEKIVQLRELKMKGLLDTMAADLRLTMADLTNLKANSNQERLEQLQALRVEQAKTREIKASYEKANSISRAQNSQISALRAEVTATKKHLQDIQGHAQRHGEEKEDLLVRLRDLESSLEALTKQNSRMNESILDHAEELEAERLRLSQALEQERARATQLGDHVEKLQNHLAKTESAVKATSEDLALEIERRKKMEEFISKRLEPPPPPPLP